MSELVPSVVPLSAGLSLQVPKLMAPAGSLLDMLNYEQVDTQGQKRIDGYARYDGGALSALNDFYVIDEEDLPPDEGVDGILTLNGVPYAIVLDIVAGQVHVASLNDNLLPRHTMGRDLITDPEEHYELLLQYMENLRSRTEHLHGAIAGLHWFRDRLYAVAGVLRLVVQMTSPIYPNDILNVGPLTSRVLNSYVLGNVSVLDIDTMDVEAWRGEGTVISRNGVPIGTVIPFNPEDFPEVASIYESRSEAQAISEDGMDDPDFGWRFVHLGWSVPYEDGLSLYGGLPALNQNLGAIGSGWSTTGGANGSPLSLTQNIITTNSRPQVNGWKNSNTPTTYGLSPSNITATDSSYIYADAYVSWDGSTKAITVSRDNLVEYSATATVEVDIP